MSVTAFELRRRLILAQDIMTLLEGQDLRLFVAEDAL